jgi:hypothetical protein
VADRTAGDGDAALAVLALPFPVVVDGSGAIARAADVAPPALVVTDQWGEVHAAAAVGGAPWMPPAEIERWVRWLAIRCAG